MSSETPTDGARTVADYGAWASPITPASLVEATVGLSSVQVADGLVWWNESRPSEGGRQVLVSARLDGSGRTDRLPPGFSARTQVHEYGGRCYAVFENTVVFSNWADQRLWRITGTGEPEPLTAEPARPRSVRYADPVISPDGSWLICVREQHGTDPANVVNDLVAIALDDVQAGPVTPVVVAEGHDFFSAPRLSPDGTQLAWLSWDHPDMPWDATVLRVAPFAGGRLGPAEIVAGGPCESVTQPRWSPDGVLHYASDRTGWWNLYAAPATPLAPADAEFSGPDWVFGQATYTHLPDGRLVATWDSAGGTRIGTVDGGSATPVELPFTHIEDLAPVPGGVIAIVGSPAAYLAVARLGLTEPQPTITILRRSRDAVVHPAWCSIPAHITFPSGGETARAWFYAPTNPSFVAPEGQRPPVIVMIHGGPTSAATSVLRPAIQYWTTRGFAVADVDYRGSTGYGRAYRDRLRLSWGICDVEDCAAAVAWLAKEDLIDPSQALIRGGSAGGFTTLAALTFTDAFRAGTSLYGIPDLELLAQDTHKFESRYLDGLIGPWPEAEEQYRARSPIHHLERLRSPVLVLQGAEDAVVPPAQAKLIHHALKERGVPVAMIMFDGEQHGFRQAATIEAAATAELAFYGRVLGFRPAGDPPVPTIDNEDRLAPR